MLRPHWPRTLLAVLVGTTVTVAQEVAAPTPVVRAVLFYSPSCPHCHQVLTVDLPPLLRRYGSQLRIVAINASTSGGSAIYDAMAQHFRLPDNRRGVPALVVGSRVLVGSGEIPAELPGIVERALLTGGIDWPAVPAIRSALPPEQARPATLAPDAPASTAAPRTPGAEEARGADTARDRADAGASRTPPPRTDSEATAVAASVQPAGSIDTKRPDRPQRAIADAAAKGQGVIDSMTPSPAIAGAVAVPTSTAAAETSGRASMITRFLLDPLGNGASVLVLVGMLVTLSYVLRAVRRGAGALPMAPPWVIPVLGAVGLGVAGYLAFIETTGARAVCGPVGDCNTVQQSEYARLFGIIPVGMLGAVGYAAIIALWYCGRSRTGLLGRLGRLGAWGAALVGTIFSAYLTFLEPFVIGASCLWCLSSALILTSLLLLLTPDAHAALSVQRAGPQGEGGEPQAPG